jgi:hypothetical protein
MVPTFRLVVELVLKMGLVLSSVLSDPQQTASLDIETVCLFPCRYNPLWLYFHSPVADFSLLVFEVS